MPIDLNQLRNGKIPTKPNKSRWQYGFVFYGLILYCLSWFLQVVKDGCVFEIKDKIQIPGVQAFLIALTRITNVVNEHHSTFIEKVNWILMSLSALTNAVVLILPFVIFADPIKHKKILFKYLCGSFIINLIWLQMFTDLRSGYYCWLFSFGLLAIGTFGVVANYAD